MENGIGEDKPGYRKLRRSAKWARADDLDYVWIDTCCIDKTKSQVLLEAINAMFSWYQQSAICYVYLSDFQAPSDAMEASFSEGEGIETFHAGHFASSRWFRRGWTLQELLAPRAIRFFNGRGEYIGHKAKLSESICVATGIDMRALCGFPLSEFSFDERLEWANNRTTKRPEDKAYSLLGIFDVRMRLDYGEGEKSAFTRLRKKIEKRETTYARLDHPSWGPPIRCQTLPEFRMIRVEELQRDSKTLTAIEMELGQGSTRGITKSSAVGLDVWRVRYGSHQAIVGHEIYAAAETRLGNDVVAEYRLIYWQVRVVSEFKRSRWRSRAATGEFHYDFIFAHYGRPTRLAS